MCDQNKIKYVKDNFPLILDPGISFLFQLTHYSSSPVLFMSNSIPFLPFCRIPLIHTMVIIKHFPLKIQWQKQLTGRKMKCLDWLIAQMANLCIDFSPLLKLMAKKLCISFNALSVLLYISQHYFTFITTIF